MAIEMGKKYRTRDGQDVRILCVDGPGNGPVLGYVLGAAMGVLEWDANGVYVQPGPESAIDLVEVNPYADIAIDTPGWGRDMYDDLNGYNWQALHFAGIDKDGRPRCFVWGCTSHTSEGETLPWDEFTTTKPEGA